ncbi:LPS export ABC transporter permease LptG [Bauldia sp.]|uniref:LPS export ABC transporter permease LptG n=1 Tax=Bauldia sp. TaxID=2575872 RepID=UPI003BA874A9
MIGITLALYFARQFAVLVIGIFVFFFFLIFAITYLEFFTRSLGSEEFDPMQVFVLTLFRVPSIAEEVLPFIILFGSIAAFVLANRRLEVVIARAAGVSAWQFLLPACIVGLVFGVLATTLYNPLSTSLRKWSDEIAAEVLSPTPSASDKGGPVWLRQAAEGRESIIGAVQTFNGGLSLAGVTVFVFGDGGIFSERIDAKEAHYTPGVWDIRDATLTSSDRRPKRLDSYALPTNLTRGQVREAFDNLESTSFWELPLLIESAQRAGLPSARYELRYNTLLSRPVVLLAMVLIAAIVSLRFSRSNELGSMILAGVGVGFMLYVVSKIAWDLGSGGIVPPPLAAWLPAIVTILMGATVLLHLEDG